MVLSREQEIADQIISELENSYSAIHVSDKKTALNQLKDRRTDTLFIDIDILEGIQSDLRGELRSFWSVHPGLDIVVMTPRKKIRQAVQAVKSGAGEYLTYPIVPDEVRLVMNSLKTATLIDSELEYLRDRQWRSEAMDMLDTKSPAMREVFQKIRSVAPTKTTVLLTGETGVGKGVLAKLIHLLSNREDARFISVHCGAIPDTLVESELFGHEKGAFTGAVKRKLGKFEIAHDGTLFLDEIGTITPAVQVKLLSVLQDATFCRVGGESILKTNARVITATNTDLKSMCEESTFRKDLYYRLNVFPIEIPPLRERPEDIQTFVEYFLKKMNRTNHKNIRDIHHLAMEALVRYSWPGNIRELENLIERAYILESSSVLTPESFPTELFDTEISTTLPIDASLSLADARKMVIDNFERQYIKDTLARHNGKINPSAEAAGISTRQLNKLMHRYGIQKESFKG